MKANNTRSFEFAATVDSVDTLENLIALGTREFYHRINRNADGSPQRWRVNGQIKRWKKDRARMRLPIKYGLYGYDAIESLDEFNKYLAIGYTELECEVCGTKCNVSMTPDPYAAEIWEDYTLHALCSDCEYESAQDI